MNIGFCHIIDPQNIGDLMSCPARYLKPKDGAAVWKFSVWDENQPAKFDVLIFGGGGMLHPGIDIRLLNHHRKAKEINPECKTIVWGVGSNYHNETDGHWPKWLFEFNLVGMRDDRWPALYEFGWYAPCASCLDVEFSYAPQDHEHEFVGYWQYRLPIPDYGDMPSITNEGPVERWPKVVAHLKSGATVITNSFHGAYWAGLLGRKSVIHRPFSSRFHQALRASSVALSHPDSSVDDCKQLAKHIEPMPKNYSWTCRFTSRKFFEEITTLTDLKLELLP